MRTQYQSHDQDPFTALAANNDELSDIYQNQFQFHAGLLRYSDSNYAKARSQEFRNIFNNISGARDLLSTLQPSKDGSDGLSGEIGDNQQIIFYGLGISHTEICKILNCFPFLKKDIESAILHLSASNNEPRNIAILNDYSHNKNSHFMDFAKVFHADPLDSFYIQIGGAPLRVHSNKFLSERFNLHPSPEYEDSEWFLDDNLHIYTPTDKHWTLNSGDLFLFRGYNSGNFAVHRGPQNHEIEQNGRLSISIY